MEITKLDQRNSEWTNETKPKNKGGPPILRKHKNVRNKGDGSHGDNKVGSEEQAEDGLMKYGFRKSKEKELTIPTNPKNKGLPRKIDSLTSPMDGAFRDTKAESKEQTEEKLVEDSE